MTDPDILRLLNERKEDALTQMETQYGKLCRRIAWNITRSDEDAGEILNDTLLAAWNAIPPEKPRSLCAFLCGIARNLALKKYEYNTAKRRSSALTTSLSELEGLLGREEVPLPDEAQLGHLISTFLKKEPPEARGMFVRRYYFSDSIADIASLYACSGSKVKSTLFRTRNRLRAYLIACGISL